MSKLDRQLQLAADEIKRADVFFITAGAGMGVDSGLPDFRGNEGFWKEYPALREGGYSFSDLANPIWFRNDAARAWGFYGHRYFLYRDTEPHAGFHILKRWADEKELESFVFTSNVDGHFQRAGFAEQQVYECHGSINFLQCVDGCADMIWPATVMDFEVDRERLVASGHFPKCSKCGGLARPNVLMFGDYEWLHYRSDDQGRRFQEWRMRVGGAKVVTIEIGAGTAIPTVRMTSQHMEGKLIRINVHEAQGGAGVLSLPLGGLEALEKIDALMR